jgi:hypothetical protein
MPVDVVLLLDVSRSMEPHIRRVATASHQALHALAARGSSHSRRNSRRQLKEDAHRGATTQRRSPVEGWSTPGIRVASAVLGRD